MRSCNHDVQKMLRMLRVRQLLLLLILLLLLSADFTAAAADFIATGYNAFTAAAADLIATAVSVARLSLLL